MPNYIGPATPVQLVQIRLGRFTRYTSEGAGHQNWDFANYPTGARVGAPSGPKKNPFYSKPWQPNWVLAAGAPGIYKTIPNVLSVKLDKKLEIGGIQTATIEIENIMYPEKAGGYHQRERGYLSPLRGYTPTGTPAVEKLLDELGLTPVEANEWLGRFSYEAQITIHQGYGEASAKVFTGLIEEADSTSRPDRITLTCRDFGKVFSEEHFFGWNKDPVINTPVVFVDEQAASNQRLVGYNANASSEEAPTHSASKVLDASLGTYWRSTLHAGSAWTEYVEIALPEGRYNFADLHVQYPGMTIYMALRPAETHAGAPTRMTEAGEQVLTVANKWLDKNGWVDLTKAEGQLVPGENGGNSYLRKFENYPTGGQSPPLDPNPKNSYFVGKNSVLRISFRNLFATEGGNRAGVQKFLAMREELSEAVRKQEQVTTTDISDIVKIICQWAGFKEWDIEPTGKRLPQQLVANPGESYLDFIKKLAESISFNFYMADPKPDGEPIDSIGVPTFRRSRVLIDDLEAELKSLREGGNGIPGAKGARGEQCPVALHTPTITDRTLLTKVQVKQSSESLAYVIRMYGLTHSAPGDAELEISSGQRLVYTYRPPWTGTPPTYADSRLAGILKQDIHRGQFFATVEECEQGALQVALEEALASISATIEIPGYPGLDLDDHAILMDLGTGISTRLAVAARSSSFIDGEKRKWVTTLTGPLIDTVDVRDVVNQINDPEHYPPNGEGGEWSDARVGSGSSLGYG